MKWFSERFCELCECEYYVNYVHSPDIDECGLNDTLCGPHGYCENRLGSFQCLCEHGYQEFQDGKQCVGMCWSFGRSSNRCNVMYR